MELNFIYINIIDEVRCFSTVRWNSECLAVGAWPFQFVESINSAETMVWLVWHRLSKTGWLGTPVWQVPFLTFEINEHAFQVLVLLLIFIFECEWLLCLWLTESYHAPASWGNPAYDVDVRRALVENADSKLWVTVAVNYVASTVLHVLRFLSNKRHELLAEYMTQQPLFVILTCSLFEPWEYMFVFAMESVFFHISLS